MFWNRNKKGEAILELINKGDTQSLKKYLRATRGAAQAKGVDGEPILFAATLSGNRELVRILLNAGADPNARNRSGETVLLWSLTPRSNAVTPLLLEHGADPNRTIGDGTSPLHIASYEGYADLVKLLIRSGAEIDRRDGGGRTPLDVAIIGNRAPVVRAILQQKVGPRGHLSPSVYEALRKTALKRENKAVLKTLEEFAPDESVNQETGKSGGQTQRVAKEADQVYRGRKTDTPEFMVGVNSANIPAACLKHAVCEYTPRIENQRIYSTAGRDQSGNLLISFEGLAVSCGAIHQYGQAVANDHGNASLYRYADLNHILACCTKNPDACPFRSMAKAQDAKLETGRRGRKI